MRSRSADLLRWLLLAAWAAVCLPTQAQTTISLVAGWNLLGNGSAAPLAVADPALLGDPARVASVWKWVPATGKWAFFAPALSGQALADYAAGAGHEVLTTISGGEGFWVNARTPFSLSLPAAPAVLAASLLPDLPSGWNLIAVGETKRADDFDVTSLWAWDDSRATWYFFAQDLNRNGGLAAYQQSKAYLDFGAAGKTLGPGVGFWVNKPATTFVNSPRLGNCPLFSDRYAFNLRVDDAALFPVVANSETMLKNIGMFGYMPMFTTVRPMVTMVTESQALLPLNCDPAFRWCIPSTMIAHGTTVPYPPSLFIVSGADHHAFVLQETAGAPAGGAAPPFSLTPLDGGSNCYLYETWWTGRLVDGAAPPAQPVTSYSAGSNVTGFTAGGLSVYDLKRDRSYVPAGVAGSSASNLPIAAGQIRYDDFFASADNVGHAMAIAFPLVRYSYIAPANTAQLPYNCGATPYNVGGTSAANAIQQFPCDFFNANLPAMGQRFRIKASFDENPYLNYPVTLKIIQWGKKWGFITTDGSPISFAINGDSDPRWQQHMWPDIQQFRNIPLSAFEAIQSGPATDMPLPAGVANHPNCRVYDLSGSVVSGC